MMLSEFRPLMLVSRPSWRSLMLLIVALLTGCGGSDRVPVNPVSGKLLVDGQPAEGAVIVFHPTSPPEKEVHKPAARVMADGTFQVTTYDAGDGAPAGDYVMTVTWGEPPSPDRLGGQYRDPGKSELKVTVNEGENVLEPIVLSLVKQASARGRGNDPRPPAER